MKKQLILVALALASLGLQADVKDKVFKFMPMRENLNVISADGSSAAEAVFKRNSTALKPDFTSVAAHQPRFVSGGLLIENGGKSAERGAWNFLPAGELFDLSGAKSSKAPGLHQDAIVFSGKIVLKDVPLKIDRQHVFSWYAKGNGELTVTPELVLKSGKVKTLKAQKFTLGSDWKREFVAFHAGAAKDADPAVAFRAVLEAADAALCAPMLEGPCVYFQTASPSTFVPNGTNREAEFLKLPLKAPVSGENGAFAFNFTPTTRGWWHALLSVGGGWKPELELSYYTDNRLTLLFRGQRLNVAAKMELGKRYCIVVNYDNAGASVWLDGRKLGELKGAGVPFNAKEIHIGSRDIEIRSNGIFSNFTVFDKTLDEAEIKDLAADADLSAKLGVKPLSCLTPYRVFPGNTGKATLRFAATGEIREATASIGTSLAAEVVAGKKS